VLVVSTGVPTAVVARAGSVYRASSPVKRPTDDAHRLAIDLLTASGTTTILSATTQMTLNMNARLPGWSDITAREGTVNDDDRPSGSDDDLPIVHELATLEQLRAVSDPLRVAIFRLLREREQTVKELCDELGESSTRLYYHVGELERVGLVRLVRTEAKSGTVHKYYRSVSPTSLLHEETGSPEQEAAVDWFCAMLENSVMDVRQAFSSTGPDFDRELTFVTRNYIRTTPERAREFVRKLEALQEELLAADDENADFRITFTASLVPTPRFLGPRRRGQRTGRSRRGDVIDAQRSRVFPEIAGE
jgi:DNA-binding transcriptional ArsR family regulator